MRSYFSYRKFITSEVILTELKGVKETMKKAYIFIGSLLIILGLIFLEVYDASVSVMKYEEKDRYRATDGGSIEVKGFFNEGDHFYFNFSSGKYWGGDPLTEPYEPSQDLGEAWIPEHKVVVLYIYTPSNEISVVEAKLPYGLYTFAIIYANKSQDFTVLPGGNLTWTDVGIEGIANKSGNYTIRAVMITPPVYKTRIGEGEPLKIEDDPPQEMALWLIQEVVTKPYNFLLPLSPVSITCGLIFEILAFKYRGKRARRAKYKKGELKSFSFSV